ncbi:MAG: T9SS type A sorting domain-containing protein [Bacteroidota bacterium]|nr:T9SS type A sorting domain-containing protein [Bacteroidota bacterium]
MSIGKLTPVPVELLDFTAYCQNDNAVLTWSTASELNNNYFTIERSTDGTNWTQIASVKGAGTVNQKNNYDFTDMNKPNGLTYYRLSQVDFDGETEKLKVKELNCEDFNSLETKAEVFPNPCKTELSILMKNWKDASTQIKVFDNYGRLVDEYKYETTQLVNLRKINTKSYIPGSYVVQVITKNEVFNLRIEKM